MAIRKEVVTWLAAVAVLSSLIAPSHAQDPLPTPVIAIVDIERVLRDSLAGQAVREQLTEISSRYQQEISTEENQLRAAEQDLQQQRPLLSPDLFGQRQQELQQQAAELQQKVRGVRRALDDALAESMSRVQAVLIEEVGRLAQERGVNFVLSRNQIVLAGSQFDLSEEVLGRLNERLPDVGIEITEEPTSAQ